MECCVKLVPFDSKRLDSLTPQRILVALRAAVYSNPERSVNTLQLIQPVFFLAEAANFSPLQNIRTRPRSYVASCPVGTGMFVLGVMRHKRVTLITNLHIMLSVGMSGAIYPPFLCACMEWIETNVLE